MFTFTDTFQKIIEIDLDSNNTIALMGESGIGKTSLVHDIAKTHDTAAFVLAVNQLGDVADLTGARLLQDENGVWAQHFFPHHVISEAIEYAAAHPDEHPILLLDEINRGENTSITSAAMTITTARTLGSKKLPENLRIMITGNVKGNITSLDEASISRFSIYHVEPDAATFLTIMGDALYPPIRKVLTEHPDYIFCRKSVLAEAPKKDDDDEDALFATLEELADTEAMDQFTTPRTIEALSHWCNNAERSDPKFMTELLTQQTVTDSGETMPMLNAAVYAHVGETVFAQAFLSELVQQMNQGSTGASSTLTVPKPQCFDTLMQQSSVDDITSVASTLSQKSIASSIVYAMSQNVNQERLISTLCDMLTEFDGEYTRRIIRLSVNDALNEKNLAVFMNHPNKVAEKVSQTLELAL